jgi:hypothetical protein
MNQYGILNSRKRAIIALIHTVAFGWLASYQFVTRQHPLALLSASPGKMTAPIALTTIYFIVTVVLLILLRYSRCPIERLYFGCCASSAGIGLLRSLLGDPTAYAGNGARVICLGCAAITGALIMRNHSSIAPQFSD